MSSLSPHCQHQLQRFRSQYLQLQQNVQFPEEECLRQESFQEAMVETVFAETASPYQPPLRYQYRVLKELMRRIESSIIDWEDQSISDELADKLAGLVAGPVPDELSAAQQKSYVTYTVSSLAGEIRNPAITLLEARNLLSAAGTTGLRTWEASLHLGSYLTTPSCVTPIAGKTVLELGAGTAYVSILCAKFLRAAHVTATDGAEEVVEDMSTNFYLNGLQDAAVINATDLKWGHALVGGEHEAWNAGRQVDVVLAADVTYDNTVLPSLVATMLDLVELFPGVDILLAATIRQERTFGTFMEMCRTAKFTVVEVDYPVTPLGEQRGPYYGDGTPIKICHITKGEAGNWNCMSAV